MRDILPTLVRWQADGRRVAIATVVERRGSAPRDPGASLALNDLGEIAGSVTGGCVEPSVIREAQEVLDGGAARLREYGIADDDGVRGRPRVRRHGRDPDRAARHGARPALARAVADDRPAALTPVARAASGSATRRLDGQPAGAVPRLRRGRGESGARRRRGRRVFVARSRRGRRCTSSARSTTPPHSRASGSCSARVTVCDARASLRHARAVPGGGRARRRVARPVPRARAGRRRAPSSACSHTTRSSTCPR